MNKKSLLDRLNPNYHYNPIAYHDSWISVDPIIGCQLNCQYCYMQMTNWTDVQPEVIYSVPQILKMLLEHKYFTPHQTVLSFANQTDPFLHKNIELTLQFLKILDLNKLKNPVVLVTKKYIPDYFIDQISYLRFVRPIFCLSYSGLPRNIEKGVNPDENRRNFRKLFDHNIRVVHFWRPLLRANGTLEALQEVMDYVVKYALASVYIGIKLNPYLILLYNRNPYLKIPQHVNEQYGDYIPEGIEERLRTLAKRKYPHYPLYMHASCAVSLALSIPDYNATIYRDPICKRSECPFWKRQICENAQSVPDSKKIRNLLARIFLNNKFEVTNEAVYISGNLNQEDYSFLLHQLNYPLIVKDLCYNRVLRGSIFSKNDENNLNQGNCQK